MNRILVSWKKFYLVCATIYDGTNQSGASVELPVGEFNAYLTSDTQMPLGDRTESVSVTPARGFNNKTIWYSLYQIVSHKSQGSLKRANKINRSLRIYSLYISLPVAFYIRSPKFFNPL